MNLGTATILRANARTLPLPDNSVDLIVTSPPYFALRSYQDGGEHYDGQLGSEPTPAEFLDALLEVTAECVRVLKPSGSLWVNLGDKYAGGGGQWDKDERDDPGGRRSSKTSGGVRGVKSGGKTYGLRHKSLMGIPWRYALRCIDDLGLILRAEVIWSKPNGLPESVTDRVRRSHEQWFYFEQSRGNIVESGTQALPLCSLCGRPADTRATLVRRLHELDPGVENATLPNEVGAHERIEGQDSVRPNEPGVVGLRGSAVPFAVPGDGDLVKDSADLLNDRAVPVVDHDAQMRAPGAAMTKGDRALPVDDSSEPGQVCRCSHPLIVNDEPWIPQQLAADLMQMVADGEADAQGVADFLSGDYARSHSTWFHFTLQPRYFSAVDEIREPHAEVSIKRAMPHRSPAGRRDAEVYQGASGQTLALDQANHPLGKLPGSVWTVPTEPLKVPESLGIGHSAAFPTEWPKRLILGWSPSGVCTACGEGRRPVTQREANGKERTGPQARRVVGYQPVDRSDWQEQVLRTITGYVCACTPFHYEPDPNDPDRPAVLTYDWHLWTPAPTTPAVVLDPFGGTGTTAMVAKALGRHGISVDLSADYCRLATWRTNDRDQLAKVLGIAKADAPTQEEALF